MFWPVKNNGKKIAVMIISIILITAGIIAFRRLTPRNEMVLATTTSTYDSGLLDEIIPIFEEEHDVRLKIMATGTGQALELGRRGDADVLFVHAPELEKEFVNESHGTLRYDVMFNEFVIVGPQSDPAGVEGMDGAVSALERLHDEEATFCSRGDDSGTHVKEKELWGKTMFDYEDIEESDWYKELGQGMGDTLMITSEKNAYTLTDEATYLSLKEKLADLEILVRDETTLYNQYGVIPSYDARQPELAEEFAEWIISDEIQERIDNYTIEGEKVFTANAKNTN